MGFNLITS
jgi:ATPase family AAA domain-containing protein 3A/B